MRRRDFGIALLAMPALDDLTKMAADPDVEYTTTPVNTMVFVDFMHKVGRLHHQPASWKDLFFPEAQGLAGS